VYTLENTPFPFAGGKNIGRSHSGGKILKGGKRKKKTCERKRRKEKRIKGELKLKR
jgi:hypothetical protein